MFSHLLVKSLYSTIALLTEQVHNLQLESTECDDKYFEWRLCLGWKILLRNDWQTEYIVHPCGSSLSFIVPSVANQFTVDHEENLGSLTPEDAATHVVAQLKNQLLYNDENSHKADVKIMKREKIYVSSSSKSKRAAFQVWVRIKYLQHSFTRRIVAFNLLDDDMIILQQDAPSDAPVNVDFGNKLLSCIEPHDSKSKGQVLLFKQNMRMMLPDAKYEILDEEDTVFKAILKPHTGTVLEGVSVSAHPMDSDEASMDNLEAYLSSFYGKLTHRERVGPYDCISVTYESTSSMGHRYIFNDIGFIHQKTAYVMTIFTKPDRFNSFRKRVDKCIRSLAFFPESVSNNFVEYYNLEEDVRIKVPSFMAISEDMTGKEESFVMFKSQHFATTISKTVLSATVENLEELKSSIIFDICQTYSQHFEQVDVKQTRMIQLNTEDAPIPALQAIHVCQDNVNQSQITYLNTYALLPDYKTVFRIQSSTSGHAPQQSLRMFLSIHESFKVLPSQQLSQVHCSEQQSTPNTGEDETQAAISS